MGGQLVQSPGDNREQCAKWREQRLQRLRRAWGWCWGEGPGPGSWGRSGGLCAGKGQQVRQQISGWCWVSTVGLAVPLGRCGGFWAEADDCAVAKMPLDGFGAGPADGLEVGMEE